MTVSTLAEIEACPRRWALSMASYPELWSERGYPPRVHLKTLAGSVVHIVLETVTRELARAGCPSVQDASAVAVLKSLGGLSKVVGQTIDQLMDRLAANPRSNRVRDHFTRSLRAQAPELRGRVQTMLCRRHMPRSAAGPAPTGRPRFRGPLANGVHCEIELRAPQLLWKGKADLLALAPDMCEITDFKTGELSDEHRFQVRTYALLWSRDNELNPTRRLADRLILAYATGDIEVPAPTQEELQELERELARRGSAAREAVSNEPPEARPDAQRCRYCGVRQLCDAYWLAETQHCLGAVPNDVRLTDAELTITGRHGPTSWNTIVTLSPCVQKGTYALLRTTGEVDLRAGDRLRLLDVSITVHTGEDNTRTAILTYGTLSEKYAVI